VDHMMGRRAEFSEELIRKLLWDNPARFYGLSAELG
jgi:hypothetical protein